MLTISLRLFRSLDVCACVRLSQLRISELLVRREHMHARWFALIFTLKWATCIQASVTECVNESFGMSYTPLFFPGLVSVLIIYLSNACMGN